VHVVDDDRHSELEALLDERRRANPRTTPDREPLGASTTRRLLGVTAGVLALSTLVLLLVFLLS
jgi:hypothetical protein